ncbi:MAG TPA: outer membrane protein assembly factor BamA [Alphaproteobacteria bacterium]|nr:outer membrane protein assembly factor BamA [Alphaproteobacteria bacterium]
MLRSLLMAGVLATAGSMAGEIAAPRAAWAQDGGRISEIRVEGLERIEPETVLSYLTVKAGDTFNAEQSDSSLKALFNTGLFADVSLRREGPALIIRVVENPIINRLAFEGNDIIERDTLEKEVQLRPRVVYTRTRVQADVKRILDLYRRRGRFAATVEPKVIQQSQNRVDLVFEINEGPATKIRQITFVGNKRFSDSQLQGVIASQESSWFSFLLSDDIYDPDKLQNDRELLRRFYLSNGYADFRVVSAVAELTPDKEDFFVTFTIEEGLRYKFGKVDLTTQLKDLDIEALRGVISHSSDDWYNANEVEETVNKLTDAVGSQGYGFVDVRPRVDRNRDNQTIDITYEVNEGPRVFVERIDIVGNTRTQDRVIRREFRLVEGDAFNTAKLNRSRQRIRDLGYFKKVEVRRVEGSAPDKAVLQAEVEEQSTGSLNVGGGFSSSQGLISIIQVTERNLMGKGQRASAKLLLGTITQEAQVSFTEPYFLDRNLSAGIDISQITREKVSSIRFNEKITGVTLRTGFNYNERLSHGFNYRIAQDEISNVHSDSSIYLQRQEGDSVTSAVGHSLTYDTRDSKLEPSEGYLLRIGNTFAGVGGSERFFKTDASASAFFPVFSDWVLTTAIKGGYAANLMDEPMNLSDRYFIGGDSFRGFERGGVGARDSKTGDSLGANLYYVGTVEMAIPLGWGREFGAKGFLFTDVGAASGIEDDEVAGSAIQDSSAPRVVIGVGLGLKTPFGPVRVDFGFPLVKEEFDQTEVFSFNFGSRF